MAVLIRDYGLTYQNTLGRPGGVETADSPVASDMSPTLQLKKSKSTVITSPQYSETDTFSFVQSAPLETVLQASKRYTQHEVQMQELVPVAVTNNVEPLPSESHSQASPPSESPGSSPQTSIPLKTIRSNGKLVSADVFPYAETSPTSVYPPIKPIVSPHQPPFDPPDETISLRLQINQTRLYPPADQLQGFMEDRLVRWHPSDSQQNVSLDAFHPYEEEKDPDLFTTLRTWFASAKPTTQVDIAVKETNEITTRIAQLNLPSNTSSSILASSNLQTTTIEPSAVLQPTYTPRAVPVSKFQLEQAIQNNQLTSETEFLPDCWNCFQH